MFERNGNGRDCLLRFLTHYKSRLDTTLSTRIRSALTIKKKNNREETVLDMVKKLQTYVNALHGPTHAKITAIKTWLQKLEDNHKKLKEEMKEGFLQILAIQIKNSCTKFKHPPDGKKRHTSQAELWFFLCNYKKTMKNKTGIYSCSNTMGA